MITHEQEEQIEAAYWLFDHARSRKEMPMSERDAFKTAVRAMLGGALEKVRTRQVYDSSGKPIGHVRVCQKCGRNLPEVASFQGNYGALYCSEACKP